MKISKKLQVNIEIFKPFKRKCYMNISKKISLYKNILKFVKIGEESIFNNCIISIE